MLNLNRFQKNVQRYRKIIISIGLILILISIDNYPVNSQSITGLNSEISSLRSRINHLESEVRNLRTVTNFSSPSTPKLDREYIPNSINNPPPVNDRSIGRSDPMFERLATLLIELKEDVRDLESRLTILESQTK